MTHHCDSCSRKSRASARFCSWHVANVAGSCDLAVARERSENASRVNRPSDTWPLVSRRRDWRRRCRSATCPTISRSHLEVRSFQGTHVRRHADRSSTAWSISGTSTAAILRARIWPPARRSGNSTTESGFQGVGGRSRRLVYVGDTDGKFYCSRRRHAARSGAGIDNARRRCQFDGRQLVSGHACYSAREDGNLYCVDLARWQESVELLDRLATRSTARRR